MTAHRHWWIEEPWLLAGANPTNEELARLRMKGFSVVLSLLEEDKQPPRYAKKAAAVAGWSTCWLPIAENGAPSLEKLGVLMARLRSYPRGTKVFLHCESGMGRAALVGAAYLVSKGLTAGDAMARLRQAGVEDGWATDERKELLRQWRSIHGVLAERRPGAFPRFGAARKPA